LKNGKNEEELRKYIEDTLIPEIEKINKVINIYLLNTKIN